MSLCLSDTSGKEDVHINDILIQEGHAQFVIDNPDLVYTEDPQVASDISNAFCCWKKLSMLNLCRSILSMSCVNLNWEIILLPF